MIDEARPEIVVIATPPILHHAIALRAFAAGAHVLCEKPLAMSRAEAQAMVDAATRAGRVGMTAFNRRFTAAMLQFHATVGENVVGRVFNLAARWFARDWPTRRPHRPAGRIARRPDTARWATWASTSSI